MSKAKSDQKVQAQTKAVEAEEKATVQETEEKATAKTEKATEKNNTVYLGPTIPGLIKESTVFFEGVLPDKVNKAVEEFPLMSKLFVDINDMTDAVKDLKKDYSVIKTAYLETQKKYL